jgi:hypothetical protein
MFDTKVIEEKYEYLISQEFPKTLRCRTIDFDYDKEKNGKLISYSFLCDMEWLGAIDGETWGITKILESVSSIVSKFFEKYKLLDNGKISTKEAPNYYIDDVFFTSINMYLDSKFEFWIKVNLYIEDGTE